MKPDLPAQRVHTRIWLEEPEPDNDFATRAAFCGGYDVYGQMLGRARWVDMLYLLFRGEAPTRAQADLLEALSVALANAGPRDPAVHAAMGAGVGGSTAASALVAALAVGAGKSTGAREVWLAMHMIAQCGTSPSAWDKALSGTQPTRAGVWPTESAGDHAAGFEAHASRASGIVSRTLDVLAGMSTGPGLRWLCDNREALEQAAGRPLSMAGVAAAAFTDLGFTPDQGEMLHLLLRLPGAAAHALEQREVGHKNFPFFALDLQDDPRGAA